MEREDPPPAVPIDSPLRLVLPGADLDLAVPHNNDRELQTLRLMDGHDLNGVPTRWKRRIHLNRIIDPVSKTGRGAVVVEMLPRRELLEREADLAEIAKALRA